MIEVAFPALGVIVFFLGVLPLAALLTAGALRLIARTSPFTGLGHLRYLMLAGASLLPLSWLLAAALHQSEPGVVLRTLSCPHNIHGCPESGGLTLALMLVSGLLVLPFVLRSRGPALPQQAALPSLSRRLRQLIAARPGLTLLSGRVWLTADPGFTIASYGWLRPRVVLGSAFAEALSDEALSAALAHEVAHLRALDPLRSWLLELALTLNPLGRRFLAPHVASWRVAREAACDRAAVLQGADPLALAEAIVLAARPTPAGMLGLGSSHLAVVQLRVGFLLAMAERPLAPQASRISWHLPLAVALALGAALLPHHLAASALDSLHLEVEHLVIDLLR